MHKSGVEENARRYFSRPGFRRMLAAIWKKYESLGRIGGIAVIPSLTPEECEAINGFFAWNLKAGDTARIPLELFEQELKRPPYPCSLPDLYTLLEGKPLLSKSEKRLLRDRQWKRLFETAHIRLQERSLMKTPLGQWVKRLEEGAAPGYRTLRDAYKSSVADAENVLLQALEALLFIHAQHWTVNGETLPFPVQGIRLPVLAARITGDSHAFDRERPAGRLLWYGLQVMTEAAGSLETAEDEPEGEAGDLTSMDTQAVRNVYRRAGILDDDISSLVHVYFADLTRPVESAVFTLRQVERMREVPACSSVYIVENPPVFSTLLDVTSALQEWFGSLSSLPEQKNRPVLICTSGQPSLAAVQLISRCLEASGATCKLFYSGDFDVKGVDIGQSLARRFGDRFIPWRFDSQTYETWCRTGPLFNEQEKTRLGDFIADWDESLCRTMAKHGRKCFQETFIDDLLQDWYAVLNICYS